MIFALDLTAVTLLEFTDFTAFHQWWRQRVLFGKKRLDLS